MGDKKLDAKTRVNPPGHFRKNTPEYFNKGLELAKGATFMGYPLEELDREELMSIAALGWNAVTKDLHDKPMLP